MNHDDKTVELELPGFTPKKPTSPAPVSAALPIAHRSMTESRLESELPWALRLVLAITILGLSLWLL